MLLHAQLETDPHCRQRVAHCGGPHRELPQVHLALLEHRMEVEAGVEARALLAVEVGRHRLRALERRAAAEVARVPLADARQRDGRGAAARAHLHAVTHEGARGRLQLRVQPGALEDLR